MLPVALLFATTLSTRVSVPPLEMPLPEAKLWALSQAARVGVTGKVNPPLSPDVQMRQHPRRECILAKW